MIWHGMDTEFEELYALSLIPKMCQNYIHRQVHLLFFGSLGSLHGATICAPAVFAYGKSYSILYVRVRSLLPSSTSVRQIRERNVARVFTAECGGRSLPRSVTFRRRSTRLESFTMPDGKRAADRLAKQRKKAWDGLTTALNCGHAKTRREAPKREQNQRRSCGEGSSY